MSKKYKIDDIDLKILSCLAENGKMSNIELSEAVGISPSPCLRRVNILQNLGIIKGYHAEIDFSYLSYNLIVFASINISVANDDERLQFEKSLSEIKEVLEVYVLSSGTDYLIKVVVKDYADYKLVINTKLSRLSFLKNIRTTRINSVLKSSYFMI
ncbi:Lrp/AsnC family transcriptional regulator [Rickettsiales bacterium LUAb2]